MRFIGIVILVFSLTSLSACTTSEIKKNGTIHSSERFFFHGGRFDR